MKRWMGIVIAILIVVGSGAGEAAVRITDDPGGLIERYIYRYERLRASGQDVIIDGFCASACTIVLATLPTNRICVTSRAELAFHAAWDIGPRGRPVTNAGATRVMYLMYPWPVRRWIDQRGGLTRRTIFLSGSPLQAMYRLCPA
ncbi:hypothetical protein SAMN05192541_14645 [Bradyrhizobium arachidis]|uniref:Uncharacterized protein n=1 Tax=Bradyrhizobium arachidis TaxID=858423 RepID=A0AAE7TK43_9BRAD|nr:hypothetical protein WN72_39495 [Bradyrhizobium arachidis]SFV19168.1 hypothetical protein SAMN05192541_14645 [Bradyrhizobium arachidis]